MGTYGLEEVISRWRRERLTTEQTVGQILLLLRDFEERLRALEKRVSSIQARHASNRIPNKENDD